MVRINLKKRAFTQRGVKTGLSIIILLIVMTWIGYGLNTTSAAEPIPIAGTWNGALTGTTSVQESSLKIQFDTVLSGTFEGDTSNGDWRGEYNSNYTVSPNGIEEKDIGTVIGGYIVTIDNSGAMSGEGVAEISGALTGSLTFEIQGQKTESGKITGTWNGILTINSLDYGGTPVAIDTKFDASGEFNGKTQAIETPSSTPTTPSPTTPSPTTTTPTITPTTTASPTPTATPISEPQPNDQYLTYAIIGVIAIIIVVGFYIFRIRRVS